MTKKKFNYIKLGTIVILAFAAFTFVLYKIGGGKNFLSNSITIYADFQDVKGLRAGNNIRYSGISVGQVESIQLKNDTTLRVEMMIEKSATEFIKTNSTASIATNGLVGNMLVNIVPSSGAAPYINQGDVLYQNKKTDMDEMLSTLAETNDKISQITENLLEITDKINNGSGSISILLNDGKLAKNLDKTSNSLSKMSADLNSSSIAVASLINDITEGKGNLGYLIKDNSMKSQIANVSNNLDSLINERTVPIFENLETSTKAMAAASKNIESIMDSIHHNKGIVGTLLSDTVLVSNLNSSLENLNKGTQKFDESMEALQHHWLIRNFFKKKEKKTALD